MSVDAFEFRRERLRRLRRDVDERDPRPLRREMGHQRGADPRAAAGDEHAATDEARKARVVRHQAATPGAGAPSPPAPKDLANAGMSVTGNAEIRSSSGYASFPGYTTHK